MTALTLPVPTPAAVDDDLIHIHHDHDEDLALCGADLRGAAWATSGAADEWCETCYAAFLVGMSCCDGAR